ncbi:hypothetical protein Ae201684P_003503 [Aphanomyces euteiches]|nr:hypothetical protein Ae201684P_003503 [Aphanomyces euteiches]
MALHAPSAAVVSANFKINAWPEAMLNFWGTATGPTHEASPSQEMSRPEATAYPLGETMTEGPACAHAGGACRSKSVSSWRDLWDQNQKQIQLLQIEHQSRNDELAKQISSEQFSEAELKRKTAEIERKYLDEVQHLHDRLAVKEKYLLEHKKDTMAILKKHADELLDQDTGCDGGRQPNTLNLPSIDGANSTIATGDRRLELRRTTLSVLVKFRKRDSPFGSLSACLSNMPDGTGSIIFSPGDVVLWSAQHWPPRYATNNVAECQALMNDLHSVLHWRLPSLRIECDSQLVHSPMSGKAHVLLPLLRTLPNNVLKALKHLRLQGTATTLRHIPRNKNKAADRLAIPAMDTRSMLL